MMSKHGRKILNVLTKNRIYNPHARYNINSNLKTTNLYYLKIFKINITIKLRYFENFEIAVGSHQYETGSHSSRLNLPLIMRSICSLKSISKKQRLKS